MSDDLEKLLSGIVRLQKEQGLVVKDSQHLDTAKVKMRLPLKDRISPDNEGAVARMKLEKAEEGEGVEESGNHKEIEEQDEKIVEQLTDDILKKYLGR